MRRLLFLFCLSVVLIFCLSTVYATTPLGGLAVALSPSGDLLVAAGDNRVLYIMDSTNLEVTNRIWLGVGIVDLQFNKDGTTLLAEDTDGTIHLISSKSWQIVKKLVKT